MAFHHRKLLHQYDYHRSPTPSPHQSPVTVLLPLPQPVLLHPEIHHHIRVLQLAMIVIGVVMILCTVSIILRSYYSRRHNHNHNHSRTNTPILFDVNGDSTVSDDDEDEERVVNHPIWFIRTVGLQQSVIDSITVFQYRKDEGLIDGTECSVCLGEFQQEESLRLLPKCSHAFHIPCIDTWLSSHKNCPLCRAPVVNDAGSGGDATEVRVTDSNVSGESETQNQEAHIENFDGGAGAGTHHVGDDDDDSGISSSDISDKILPNSLAQEEEEEIQPVRRSVSLDLSSASVIFRDVVESSLSSETHFGDKIDSSSKDMSMSTTIGKHGSGSGSSSTICKLASLGRALQKRPISTRRSLSHNRKFLFSRHCRSQSSTLPL